MSQTIIILSEKSSGSSILQSELAMHPDINHVKNSPHSEFETLYWTKAACLLGKYDDEHSRQDMKQYPIIPPYTKSEAKEEIIALVASNTSASNLDTLSDADLVDQGWMALTQNLGPIFLEKSPHHLRDIAAIETMLESLERVQQKFLVIGLTRHPRSVLYSAWERWRSWPNRRQWGWIVRMNNLKIVQQKLMPKNFYLLKYEDLVSDPQKVFNDICKLCKIDYHSDMGKRIHKKSLAQWKHKNASLLRLGKKKIIPVPFHFIYKPCKEIKTLGKEFGYDV